MTQTALAQLMIDIKPSLERKLDVKLHDGSLGRPHNFKSFGALDFIYSVGDTQIIEIWSPRDGYKESQKISVEGCFFDESMQEFVSRVLETKIKSILDENQ